MVKKRNPVRAPGSNSQERRCRFRAENRRGGWNRKNRASESDFAGKIPPVPRGGSRRHGMSSIIPISND